MSNIYQADHVETEIHVGYSSRNIIERKKIVKGIRTSLTGTIYYLKITSRKIINLEKSPANRVSMPSLLKIMKRMVVEVGVAEVEHHQTSAAVVAEEEVVVEPLSKMHCQ